MKKNAYFQLLIVGFLGFLCFSGQSPRKEVQEITTVECVNNELETESSAMKKDEERKSAARRTREHTGHTTMNPKSAAKRAIEREETYFD